MSTSLLPIAEVTLLEDRARVLRRGRVKVAAGSSRICILAVAPVLVDKSLSARVIDSDQVRILNARVTRQRRIKPEDQPDAIRALADQQAELERERAALSDRRAVLLTERDAVDRLIQVTLQEIADDVAWGRGNADNWGGQLDRLSAREHEIIENLREIGFAERDLRERMERLGARRSAQETPASKESAQIELQLMTTTGDTRDNDSAADTEVMIEVDYMIPGACWRPYHSATLIETDADGPRVHVRCEGCVWQNTGEDWTDVMLRFSTQRPSLGASPPVLTEDRLDIQRKRSELVVEAREQQITTTGLGGAQSEASAELPGIDDGGAEVNLRANSSASIPSDGAPYRVLLFEFESDAVLEHVVAGELAPAVIVRTVQNNQSSQPLLAGPVDLIRKAGYAGRSSILYIAPGEKFELGWGPDPALRVYRRDERLEDESRMLSAWTTQRHQITIRLSNIGDQARTIRVKERVPVSEIDKVKITVDRHQTSQQAQPDSDGFLDWTVELNPFGQDLVTLRYEIKKHDDVRGL